jgi:hypothetical protein
MRVLASDIRMHTKAKEGNMYRTICGLIFVLLISTPSFAQQSLVGTYKLMTFATEIEGQPPLEVMGKSPRGYLVLTPTRWIHIITAEKRKFGTSVEEKSALWESLSAYTGPYRLDGSKIIVSVDASWNESWNGTQVTRSWQLDGTHLSITTERAPYSRDPSKMAVTRVEWEKVE